MDFAANPNLHIFSYSIAKNKTAAVKLLWLSVFMILFLIPKLP